MELGKKDIPYQGAGSKQDSRELNTRRRAQAPAGETSNKGQVKPSKQGMQSISSARLNGMEWDSDGQARTCISGDLCGIGWSGKPIYCTGCNLIRLELGQERSDNVMCPGKVCKGPRAGR